MRITYDGDSLTIESQGESVEEIAQAYKAFWKELEAQTMTMADAIRRAAGTD